MPASFPPTAAGPEVDPLFTAGGATDVELAAAVATVNAALAAKQESATAATDAELVSAVATLNTLIAAKQDSATAATDTEVADAIAAHAAGDASDSELAAAVASLTASLALKQDAATAATDTELSDAVEDLEAVIAAHEAGDATDAELSAAVTTLNASLATKQDAATAATDAELAAAIAAHEAGDATDAELAAAVASITTALAGKQDAATAATQAELDAWLGTWKEFGWGGLANANTAVAGIYPLTPAGPLTAGAANSGLAGRRFDPNDYALTGYTLKMRLVGRITTGSVNPALPGAGVYGLRWYRQVFGHAATAGGPTATFPDAAIGGIQWTNPGASLLDEAESTEFTAPAVNYYALALDWPGAAATNAYVNGEVRLQFRHVPS